MNTESPGSGREIDIPELAVPRTDTESEDAAAVEVQTEVIGDQVTTKKIRRPWDLARLLAALVLIAVVVAIGFFATATTAGLGQDLEAASRQLPGFVEYVLDLIGFIGLLALPAGVGVQLVLQKRGRQFLEAFISLVVATLLLVLAAVLITELGTPRFIATLSETSVDGATPVVPLLGGLIAFVTTARLMNRGFWAAASVVVIVSLTILTIIAGGTTIAGITCSLLAGWAIGLGIRYALGTPTTRPSGIKVAETLARAGLPVDVLESQGPIDIGRLYEGRQHDGRELQVVVLDRDLEGAGLGRALWSSLRLRDSNRKAFSLRRTVDHRALMAFSAEVRDIPAAQLLAAREINADSSLLAYANVAGVRLETMDADDVDDDLLDNAFRALLTLRKACVAHRRLNAHNLAITPDHNVTLLDIGHGEVAAGDVALRIDLAELLCTLALIVGPDRAIASARRILGDEALMTCMPALQPVALNPTTRKAMRQDKKLLVTLRESLAEINPDIEIEDIEIERVKPRTIIFALVGTVAAYFVVLQLTRMLSGVDLGEIIATANWWWVLVGLGASLITYPGSAWSLSGFVPEKLKLWPTTLVQLAGDFVTLITPPTLGAVAINLRYLQKRGIHPALATASIGVSQVGAFAVHTLLLLGFGILAGTQQDFSLHVPTFVFLLVGGVLLVAAALFALQPTRRLHCTVPSTRRSRLETRTIRHRRWRQRRSCGRSRLPSTALKKAGGTS